MTPVGVASVGAQVQVSHLRILRDIYYGAVSGEGQPRESCDVRYDPSRALPNRPVAEPQLQHVDFSLLSGPSESDKFFLLGDNSSRSKDGRLWGREYWVSRELLIGKALYIYWPHSWNRVPLVNIPFPYFPNFSRMGLVR